MEDKNWENSYHDLAKAHTELQDMYLKLTERVVELASILMELHDTNSTEELLTSKSEMLRNLGKRLSGENDV